MNLKKTPTILIVLLFSSVSFALDPLGPPIADLGKSQGSLGIEYSYTEFDDVDFNKIYGRLGIGFGNIDLFLRLGVVETDLDILKNSDYEFAIGGGTKITLHKEKNIKWGLITQFIYYEPDYDTSSPFINMEAEIFELQVAIGPKLKLSNGFHVYGGPMLYYVDGEAKYKRNGITLLEIDNSDTQFGGYGGFQIDLDKKTDLNIEFQIIEDGYGIGSQIIWRF